MNLACLVAVGVSVFLSPDDACVTAIMRELRRADSEIFVQAVAITLPDVLNGLDLAVKRGVKVTVDTMHSRAGTTIVIDRKTVIAGSLQLVPRGVGHLFIIKDDPDIALKFSASIVDHRGHTAKYTAKMLSRPTEKRLAGDEAQGLCQTCNGTKLVTCEQCDGKWARVAQMVPCERKRGVGCDGDGTRKCFTCKGQPQIRCTRCKGKGYYKVGKRSIGDRRLTIYAGCIECGGSGEGRMVGNEYRFRRGNGKTTCTKCQAGQITCPRCRGKGTYEKKAKCPDCTKGKADCPQCTA